MKVVVPCIDLHPVIPEVLESEGVIARYFDVAGDDEAYWSVLCAMWAETETFIVLQDDKIPMPGAISAIHECSSLWCAYHALASNGEEPSMPSLSCAKFDGALMSQFPRLMVENVGMKGYGQIPPRHHYHVDRAINDELTLRGLNVCWHPLA